jgi:hypothetical protein
MKTFVRVFVFGSLLAAGIWLWVYFHPSPQEAIRRQLAGLAKSASFDGPQGMVAHTVDAQKFAGYFGPNVRMTIEPRGFFEEETTRQEISQFALGFRSRSGIRSLRVQVLDPVITLGTNNKSAIVEVTINAESGGERHLLVQEIKLTMKEIEGKWLIVGVETVRTLNRGPQLLPAALPVAT